MRHFLEQITKVAKAQDVVVMGDLNYPDICGEKQYGRIQTIEQVHTMYWRSGFVSEGEGCY